MKNIYCVRIKIYSDNKTIQEKEVFCFILEIKIVISPFSSVLLVTNSTNIIAIILTCHTFWLFIFDTWRLTVRSTKRYHLLILGDVQVSIMLLDIVIKQCKRFECWFFNTSKQKIWLYMRILMQHNAFFDLIFAWLT